MRKNLPALRPMNSMPRDRSGLIWIDPLYPHTPYGFTDNVVKTGNELFCSLLYWEASGCLAKMAAASDDARTAADFRTARRWWKRTSTCSRMRRRASISPPARWVGSLTCGGTPIWYTSTFPMLRACAHLPFSRRATTIACGKARFATCRSPSIGRKRLMAQRWRVRPRPVPERRLLGHG